MRTPTTQNCFGQNKLQINPCLLRTPPAGKHSDGGVFFTEPVHRYKKCTTFAICKTIMPSQALQLQNK